MGQTHLKAGRQEPVKRANAKGRDGSTEPDPIDVHVGQKLKLCRTLLGMSQEDLAASVGLTSQQVQKYERGIDRMGANRLFGFANALGVPVAHFFEDIPSHLTTAGLARPSLEDAEAPQPLVKREILELVRNYTAIGDIPERRAIYTLIKSMARRKPDASA